jgi:hypothetical protein
MLQIFGPRHLEAERLDRITNKLSKLSGVKVDVFAFALGNPWNKTESEESIELAKAIADALNRAHMDAAGWVLGSCKGASASNVIVDVKREKAEDLTIALEILKALTPEVDTFPEIQRFSISEGCSSILSLDNSRPNKRKPDATISITAGRKIASILTPEMLGNGIDSRPVTPSPR